MSRLYAGMSISLQPGAAAARAQDRAATAAGLAGLRPIRLRPLALPGPERLTIRPVVPIVDDVLGLLLRLGVLRCVTPHCHRRVLKRLRGDVLQFVPL